MKSATVAFALLASIAVAQPHGHHHHHELEKAKRNVVIEYTTVYETATVWVDELTTETVQPTHAPETKPATVEAKPTTSVNLGGQFNQQTSSSQSPVVQSPTVEAKPSSQTPAVVDTPTSVYSPPAQTSSASSGGGSGGSTGGYDKAGKMTYYQVGLGSCGYDDSGADQSKNIVAVSVEFFQSVSPLTSYGLNQPANPLCDKTITVSANGKTVDCVIRDSCPSCAYGSIDVTEKVFKELFGSLDAGKVDVQWKLNP